MPPLSEEEIQRLAKIEMAKIEAQRRKQEMREDAERRKRIVVQSKDEKGTERREIMFAQYFRNKVTRNAKGRLSVDNKEVLSVQDFPPARE